VKATGLVGDTRVALRCWTFNGGAMMATPVWGSLTDIVRALGWWGMETDPADRKSVQCERRSNRTERPILPHAGQRAIAAGPRFYEQGSECQRVQWDPKGGELYLATVRPWETAVEAGHRPDVQIELSEPGIGAKDSSNHLVAGFLRSVPQDSRSWTNEEDGPVRVCQVSRVTQVDRVDRAPSSSVKVVTERPSRKCRGCAR
jgi:hypothetical protein